MIALFEQRKIVELGAVVKGDGLESAAVSPDGPGGRARNFGLVASAQLLDDRVAGLALHQGEQTMPQVTTHDGIAFPVANALAARHFGRPLTNGPLARHHPAGVVAAVALAADLAHDAGMAPQLTASLPIPTNMPVDRLVADVQHAILPEHPGDLFRAPLAAHQPDHPRHVHRTEPRAPAAASTARICVAMGLLRSIVAVVMGNVAPQFAHDGAAVPPHRARNLRSPNTASQLRRNPVSFFLGELVIRFHGCNPVPGRMRR